MAEPRCVVPYEDGDVDVYSDMPTEIVPGLFLGNLRTKDNRELCEELNIVARIAIYRRGDSIPWATGPPACVQKNEKSGARLMSIPVFDSRKTNLLLHFFAICNFIIEHADLLSAAELLARLRSDRARHAASGGDPRKHGHGHGPASERPRAVLVHCVMGISRSATAVAAFLVFMYGMSWDMAIEFIGQRRPQVYPNKGFQVQLKWWDIELRRVILLWRKMMAKEDAKQAKKLQKSKPALGCSKPSSAVCHGRKSSHVWPHLVE